MTNKFEGENVAYFLGQTEIRNENKMLTIELLYLKHIKQIHRV